MNFRNVDVFFLTVVAFFTVEVERVEAQQKAELTWLSDHPPAVPIGVSWGVPWPEGEVSKDAAFKLQTSDGHVLPVQTWPTAYWPDGSVKWSGLATVADSQAAGPLTLTLADGQNGNRSSRQDLSVNVVERNDAIQINTGSMIAWLPKSGADLIDSLVVDGRKVAGSAHLVAIHQEGDQEDVLNPPPREKTASWIDSVSIEQDGPVRAVVRYDGIHKGASSDRKWLPFTVRLYFYAGRKPIKMVHSVMYDGEQDQDFIKGLGVQFEVPMREQIHNRHVRFSGKERGLWAEPVKPLESRRPITYKEESVYPDQEQGKRVPDITDYAPLVQGLINDLADWNSYKLVQESPMDSPSKREPIPKVHGLPPAGSRCVGCWYLQGT
ncbi:MAG: hypothetical protein U5K69_27765 [Balneolaceae bacterium]|nr:hypothetical protein [Balneolaceae bacterium]